MKLLASDYDGTLKQNIVDPKDIKTIELFRKAGNIFGIVTGRTIGMIKNELAYFQVPYDFIIGTNGGIAVNKDLKIIYRNDMDYTKAVNFMDEVKELDHIKVGVSNGDIYAVVCDKNNRNPKEKKTFTLIGTKISSISEVLETKTINSFFIRGKDEHHTKGLMQDFLIKYGNDFNFHYNGGTIDVSNFGISKETGVLAIGEHYGCALEDISVIGDGYNDISMIRKFKGYSVSTAPEVVQDKAKKIFDTVSDCISYITNNSD